MRNFHDYINTTKTEIIAKWVRSKYRILTEGLEGSEGRSWLKLWGSRDGQSPSIDPMKNLDKRDDRNQSHSQRFWLWSRKMGNQSFVHSTNYFIQPGHNPLFYS